MEIDISSDKIEMGAAAAALGAAQIRKAISEAGAANIILATGASQFEMLSHLVAAPDIDWHRVTVFHLDEYVGLPISHPSSFRRYLWERFEKQLPVPLRAFHYLNGEQDPEGECRRVGDLIRRHTIDVAFVGIGENGHLAFNDPPADFLTDEAFHVVELDEDCRYQQYREGWFETLDLVPRSALSMTVPQVMKSRVIVCTVPDQRKAQAVHDSLEGPVTNEVPASILQQHRAVTVFLDQPAASLLGETTRKHGAHKPFAPHQTVDAKARQS